MPPAEPGTASRQTGSAPSVTNPGSDRSLHGLHSIKACGKLAVLVMKRILSKAEKDLSSSGCDHPGVARRHPGGLIHLVMTASGKVGTKVTVVYLPGEGRLGVSLLSP